jgi:hypothetical protein
MPRPDAPVVRSRTRKDGPMIWYRLTTGLLIVTWLGSLSPTLAQGPAGNGGAPTTAPTSQPAPIRIPIQELGSRYCLIGNLGVPLGSIVKVEDVITTVPLKAYGGCDILRLPRINGRAVQEYYIVRHPSWEPLETLLSHEHAGR